MQRLIFLSLFAFFIFSTAAFTAENKDKKKSEKPSPTLILESANSNENTLSNGEFISMLRGNVVFVYDDIRIRSDEATWWRQKGAVAFRNNIRVNQRRQVITCNRMNYTKENNLLTASGKFDYFDSTELTRLRGGEAEYLIASKIFFLKGNPVLIRYDTAVGETLTIHSLTMRYVDSIKRATGIDSVRIHKGKLYSKSALAHYFTNTNKAFLRGKPDVWYDAHRITGDSVNLNFTKESLQDASVVGAAHGIYVDTGDGRSKDSAYTHIWGDSLYMAVSDSGRLEVIWSVGKASSKTYESRDPQTANTASGKIMMLGFGDDGNVKNLKIWGNARSTYFMEDRSGRGCNEVSGDSVAVLFTKGRAHYVTLAGSTRGIYFPLP